MASLVTSMTEVFTPPAPCSTSWTYEVERGNNVPGGLIMQNAHTYVSSCWPSGFDHVGRVENSLVYNPGWCPAGYSSANVVAGGVITTAICCLSDFDYYTTTQSYGNGGYDVYAGCTSMFPSGNSTVLPVRQETSTTEVEGPITMWAQPITVALESSDSSLFVPAATSSTSSIPQETSTTSTSSTFITASTPASTESESNPSASDAASNTKDNTDTSSSSGGGLSTGAGIGIGVGVGVGGLAVFAAVGLFFWRARKAKQEKAPAMAPNPVYDGWGGQYYPAATPPFRVQNINEIGDTSVRQKTGVQELWG